MSMNTSIKVSDTAHEVNRARADRIARRMAKSARVKAGVLWSLGQYREFFQSEREFADYAYDFTYKAALKKAIAKQMEKKRSV